MPRQMNFKHTREELRQLQALPLELKIAKTKTRVREWVEFFGEDGVYLSFSGGKDSTVLKHIIDGMGYDIPSVFVNTGLEFPEIQKFVRDIKKGLYPGLSQNVEIIRPQMLFSEVLSKHGYPVISKEVAKVVHYAKERKPWAVNKISGFNTNGTYSEWCQRYKKYAGLVDADYPISAYCCDEMKKKPFHQYERETGRVPIVGTTAEESQQRTSGWLAVGCNAFDSTKKRSAPMSFWTEQDILRYLKEYGVPFASVYGDLQEDEHGKLSMTRFDRTGCIFCMFGAHREKEPNRFQRIKESHPVQYNYCIHGGEYVDGLWKPSKEGLGLGHVLDQLGVPYE